MSKMSITRALAEIKRIDDRIVTSLTNSEFVGVTIGKGDKQRMHQVSQTQQQAISKFQSNKDSLDNLFTQRARIKAAIVKSNAETFISLGKESISVAEAIERKRSIELKRNLLRMIQSRLVKANTDVNLINERLNAEIEGSLGSIYGSDKAKIDENTYETVAKPKREQKEAALLDPLNVTNWVAQLEEEISLTDTELDFTLSEINAKTEIDV